MEKAPYSILPALASKTFLYLFNYAGNADDFELDKTAYHTELEKHLLINNTPAIAGHGIDVTGTDLTISASGDKRTIALATALTEIGTSVAYPLVMYQGTPIPYSDFESVDGSADALGLITLKSGTTTTYSSPTATDYRVWYSDPVLGLVQSAEVGGISLPIESTSFNAVGHEEPVYKLDKRSDLEATGSITLITSLKSILFEGDTSPVNRAGQELESRIYGSDWSSGGTYANSRSEAGIPTNPFGVCLLTLSGLRLASGTGQGQVWAKAIYIYHCLLTSLSNPANISNDATDPVLQTVEFSVKHPKPVYARILTTS